MTTKTITAIKRNTAAWLRQGISPRRLALTLALGFAVGCIPVVGVPTVVCGVLALVFRLNLAAIQAANYAVMPLQLVMIVPFVRLGKRLFAFGPQMPLNPHTLIHASPLATASVMGWLTLQALLAWLLIAIPMVTLLTATLTVLLRKVPAVAAGEIAN